MSDAEPPFVRFGDLDDEIRGVGRRLDAFAEDARTRFDVLTEKVVNGMAAIANQMASIALDVGQLMNERADNRRRLDDHGRRHEDHDKRHDEHERRLAALEAPKKRKAKK